MSHLRVCSILCCTNCMSTRAARARCTLHLAISLVLEEAGLKPESMPLDDCVSVVFKMGINRRINNTKKAHHDFSMR